MLDEGTIVPFLYTEETPIDEPNFEVQKDIFSRWQNLCKEVSIHCIRLSWKNNENKNLTRIALASRFHSFGLSATAGDIDTYVADLRLDSTAKSYLRQRLVELGHFCLNFSGQGKLVTRNDIYKAFITEGEDPAKRLYSNVQLAGEIKQLIDLSYNCNLPDALDGYLITPVDSLPRVALQELKQATKRSTITGKELLRLLQQTAFDLIEKGLNIGSMDALRLQDVREIRDTDEWKVYIQSLSQLLKYPRQFAGRAVKVYESYGMLTQQLTDRISKQQRKDSVLSSWEPSIEFMFNIAGAILTWQWTKEGPVWRIRNKISSMIEGDSAPIVGKFVIRDMAEEKPQQDLSTGIDFMRFEMPDVQEQWKYIERHVRKLPGFQDLPIEKEIVDPTMSYKEKAIAQ